MHGGARARVTASATSLAANGYRRNSAGNIERGVGWGLNAVALCLDSLFLVLETPSEIAHAAGLGAPTAMMEGQSRRPTELKA
jgi:hypothetical protein